MKVDREYCGKSFNRKPSEILKRSFCSVECFRKAEPTRKGKYIQCKYCGKRIYRTLSALKRPGHFFCNRKCQGNWASENLRGDKAGHYKNALNHEICAFCGKEFTTYHKTRKYCSRTCYFTARHSKNIEKLICHNCGKTFERLKSASKVRGKRLNFCSVGCKTFFMRGKNAPRWIEDRDTLKNSNHSFRERAELKDWRMRVFKRDNYTCQMCHIKSSKGNKVFLNAHHIKKVADYPLLAFDTSNGITLCKECHLKTLGKEKDYEKMFRNLLLKKLLKAFFDRRINVLGKVKKGDKDKLFEKFVNCYGEKEFRCYYCGKKMELKWGSDYSFTFDHYIPKSKSGANTAENLVFCCRGCNFSKGNMDAEIYISNVKRLKARKLKREIWKARKAAKKDKKLRDSYKEIFQHVKAQ